jgi:hypothetical protein
VQVYGHAAWRGSHGQELITRAVVDKAVPAATAELERSKFAQRWQQASPRERDYLVALAEQSAAGGPPTGAAVAGRLGKPPTSLLSTATGSLPRGPWSPRQSTSVLSSPALAITSFAMRTTGQGEQTWLRSPSRRFIPPAPPPRSYAAATFEWAATPVCRVKRGVRKPSTPVGPMAPGVP